MGNILNVRFPQNGLWAGLIGWPGQLLAHPLHQAAEQKNDERILFSGNASGLLCQTVISPLANQILVTLKVTIHIHLV